MAAACSGQRKRRPDQSQPSMRQKRAKPLACNHAAVYESLSSPTSDRLTLDSNISISPTSYSGLPSPYPHQEFCGTPIDPALTEWPVQGPHFASLPNQVPLDDMGRSCYGEGEQMGAGSQISDSGGDLFPECFIPMGSGDSQPGQTLAIDPGFSNSQTPNQLSMNMYLVAEDYIFLGPNEEVDDSPSEFLDVGYPPFNLPTNPGPPRSDSTNSSEWSHLVLEDSNGGESSRPRTTEILPAPPGGDPAPTTSPSEPARKRRVRGQFKTLELREKTSLTRKLGACLRCRMQKVRCKMDENDPSGFCNTCKGVSKPTIHKLCCVRCKLGDCQLYRTGSLGYSTRWPEPRMNDVTNWASGDIRVSTLKSTMFPSFAMLVRFRKFIPNKDDMLERSWSDNKGKRHVKITPYAIAHMAEAARDFQDVMDGDMWQHLQDTVGKNDPLLSKTYEFAKHHLDAVPPDDERLLLQNVLRMCFMVRFSCGSCFLEGDDTLGIPAISDQGLLLSGKVPYPPVANDQLCVISSVKILMPLQKAILEALDKFIQSNRPQYWTTVFLSVFILLHNCSVLTWDRYRHALKHAVKLKYTLPRFVEHLHSSANILLSYFHYYKGDLNLYEMDWKNRHLTRLAHLSPTETNYFIRIVDLAKQREDDFRLCWEHDQFEHELYFVSQMFETDWSPRDLYKSPE